jgi:hypothetical protein
MLPFAFKCRFTLRPRLRLRVLTTHAHGHAVRWASVPIVVDYSLVMLRDPPDPAFVALYMIWLSLHNTIGTYSNLQRYRATRAPRACRTI